MAVIAGHASAASYVVPPDEYLIDRADSIVTGIVLDRWSEPASSGGIETVHRLAVDQTLKGSAGAIVEIREWGGVIGDRWMSSSAAPRYVPGERYLVLLRRSSDGRLSTLESALGQFRYATKDGDRLLIRPLDRSFSIDIDGNLHRERDRPAGAFETLVRSRAGNASRRAVSEQAQANPEARLDAALALEIAIERWSRGIVRFTAANAPAASNRKDPLDGEDRIILGDPRDELPGSFDGVGLLAVAFVGGRTEVDRMIIEGSDVVVQDGVSPETLKQTTFNTMMTHELGHTLGFRHSNTDRFGQPPCDPDAPCAPTAVMSALLLGPLDGVLQPWDLDALHSNYGSSGRFDPAYLNHDVVSGGDLPWHRPKPETAWFVAECHPPARRSAAADATSVRPGTAVSLSVESLEGESVAWFMGGDGESELMIGSGPRITVVASRTTTYRARLESPCGTTHSDPVTVTVTRARAVNRR